MCGIFGVVTGQREVDLARLVAAGEALRHRGPDGRGYLLDGPSGFRVLHDADAPREGVYHVGFAHTRLAIIDLVTGQQPVGNEDGSVWCVFNGEVYGYRELRAELAKRGHVLRTQSDTEVLCHGWEEWGTRLTDHVQGMFAFALYDRRKGTLALFRDPLGIKPLIYAHGDGYFAFASEIKALLSYDPAIRIDREAVFDFFLHDQIPPPRTAFRGVTKLDAGEYLVLDCPSLRVADRARYWDFRFEPQPRDARAIAAEVEATLERVVLKQSIADVPVGTFLSGGIDSSLVTRALRNHGQARAIHLHSEDAFSELRWAMNPGFTGIERLNVLYRPTLEDCLESLATVDDLMRDASILPTHLVSRAAAAAGLKVILSGDGGDENFAGYDTIYYPAYLYEKHREIGLPSWGRNRALFRLFCLLAGIRRRHAAPLWRYLSDGGYLPRVADVEIANLLSTRKHAPADVPDFRAAHLDGFSSNGDRPDLDRLLYLHYRFFLNVILAKVDYASMANSVEVRVPLLDLELVRLALSIPLEIKMRRGGKYPLKAVAEKYFGSEFAWREKAGFIFDVSALFRDPAVEAHFRQSLTLPGLEEFLDIPSALRLLELDKTVRRHGKKLWRVLAFAEWWRNWGARHA